MTEGSGGGDERARPPGEPGGPSSQDPAATPDDVAGRPTDPASPLGRGPEPGQRRGRMSYQDESTAPREPTLAERRARQQAARREREEASARHLEQQARSKKRKRILIGSGVTVGVVAIIAIGYAVASGGDDEVEARCVGTNNVVVDDSNCVTPASSNSNYYHSGGGFYPIFIGAGGGQYHYNYGGGGNVGQVASGGTNTVPKDSATVKSGTSGKTISRGGLGVSSGSKGSSGGSGSSGS